MWQVTQAQMIEVLQALGVHSGDGLLIHSAIQFLGQPVGGVGMYYDTLCFVLGIPPPILAPPPLASGIEKFEMDVLSRIGTLAVPTFNFAFARGEPYDPQRTPSKGMGTFSEYVRQRPEARRTPHPMQSLAVVGRYADDLAGRDTPSAFEPESPFERLLELDFKLLLLGADIQAVSMIHYSEQRADVPYRYWKDFSGQVRVDQFWQECTYRMFARNLDLNPQLDLHPLQAILEAQGRWNSVPLNYGLVSVCRLVDFVAAADQILANDPWSFVCNKYYDLNAGSYQ